VTQFLDVVLKSEHTELYMEECDIKSGSQLAGKTLGNSKLRAEVGVTVLAVDLPDEIVITHPDPDTLLPVGARLIVLGTREQLQKLHRLIS
jgi:K+/H+ antiporter YhaU regulatory subunit KhtT